LVRNGRSDNPFRIGYTAAPQLLALGPLLCILSSSAVFVEDLTSRRCTLAVDGMLKGSFFAVIILGGTHNSILNGSSQLFPLHFCTRTMRFRIVAG